MDWLPEWAQIAVSVAGAASIAGGLWWNLVRRVDAVTAALNTHETTTTAKHEELERDMAKLEDTSEKLLEKAESRDAQLAEQGIQLTRVATQIETQFPMFMNALQKIESKLDNGK